MSTSRLIESSTIAGRSIHSTRINQQTTVDAKLHADFEESGESFDYSSSVHISSTTVVEGEPPRSDKVTTTYLHHIQKCKLIQPFGCLLALDDKTYRVIAYSENAPEMLTAVNHTVPAIGENPVIGMGTDVRTVFAGPSANALFKALTFGEVSLLNPIVVHCKTTGKPFYAIIHRVTGSLIIDFEPVMPNEAPMTAAGSLQSYKHAAKAIARLQSLPIGSIERLCDTMVQEVFELTGYDRVMAYKFHDDDHGEVVAEITKPGLEPYLGLHYPATDIPQAARFLFIKNKVRMICDCRAKNVKVVQDKKLQFDLTLCGSTLRATHSCHLQYMENMTSTASLVMAVVINDAECENSSPQKWKRLWGLVVCHNTSPRFVPFPLRCACEFLAQVFAVHISKELELEHQLMENNILRTQTLLCDLLMRDAPLGIVSQSPNISDLVKCDGACLLYQDKVYRMGVSPTEFQIHDIVSWLNERHMDSTGLSTDSLYNAEYPGALALCGVCGMASVKLTGKDILFWFRSGTASDVRWGGAKRAKGEKDDGRRMHPRSSFKAFLEVVKHRSNPWKEFEMDAIHSLQLMMRNALKENEAAVLNYSKVIQASFHELKLDRMQELEAVTSEMVRLIKTASVPILAFDSDGLINGWNTKIAELTGLTVEEAIGRHILTFVEDSSVDIVQKMLSLAVQGKEETGVRFEIKTYGSKTGSGPITLVVNACSRMDVNENVVGVCCIAHDITYQKTIMDKFTRIEGDYKAIVHSPNPLIPPIFGTDEFGWCSKWNQAMTDLTGLSREQVIGKMLLGEVFGIRGAQCRLGSHEMFINTSIVLNKAMLSQEAEKISFGFYAKTGKYVDCVLCASKRVNSEGTVNGLFCFLQLPSKDLQQAIHYQRMNERVAAKLLKTLAYVRRQVKNPLSGILFSRKMLEETELGDDQKELLHASALCQQQLNKVLEDTDLDGIVDGDLDLEMTEFTLQQILGASISQVMTRSNKMGIQIVNNIAQDTLFEKLYGDSVRLQQVLAEFLSLSVSCTPPSGMVIIAASMTKNHFERLVPLVNLELRITHTGDGVPEDLVRQMFGSSVDATEEGISLLISRNLLKLMSGDVHYLREATKSTFIISVELASVGSKKT
ncbi:putative PAS domain, phytochrome, GAF domain, histidine kinase/HSP90-like ATPase [Helianthus annuus]|nr:putative PAS domain, phytochrome, GAF domain, histidine kinase/HSP90-like ATPase [Helianthus annuus]